MLILAMDPGIRGCGVALLNNSTIVHAAYVKNPARKGNGLNEIRDMAHAVRWWVTDRAKDEPAKVVAEFPQYYRAGHKGEKENIDPNDLFGLAGVDGAVVTLFPQADAVTVRPADWKRQMNKDVTAARVRARLEDDEKLVVEAAAEAAGSLAHNMLDACGIGLHFAGRFERRRVIVR